MPAVYLLTIVVAYHCTVAQNIASEAVLGEERRISRLRAIVLDANVNLPSLCFATPIVVTCVLLVTTYGRIEQSVLFSKL